MQIMSWKEKYDRISYLIFEISENYGGDPPGWLPSYIKDIIDKYKYNMDLPLECFEDLYRNMIRRI